MGPARIYPWRKMRRSRAPSIAPGKFFVAQSWADCITNMAGFNLRQAQGGALRHLAVRAAAAASFNPVPVRICQRSARARSARCRPDKRSAIRVHAKSQRTVGIRTLRAHNRRGTRTPRNLSSGQASRGPVGSAAPRSDGQSNAWPMTAGKTSMAGTSPAMTISRRGVDQGTAGQATSWT